MRLVVLHRAHDPQVLADIGDLVEFSVRLALVDDRPRAIRELVSEAKTRVRLEELHDVFLDRLHQKSSDFDASRGLVVTIAALQLVDETSPRTVAEG